MPYGLASEPLNFTPTLLMSMQVRFAPIFENLTKSCLVPAKNLAPYLPRNHPKTCPGPGLKILENSGICPGPLKILPGPAQDLVRGILLCIVYETECTENKSRKMAVNMGSINKRKNKIRVLQSVELPASYL